MSAPAWRRLSARPSRPAQRSEPPELSRDVIIVGGGIIGLASAAKLQDAGRGVTVIERAGLVMGASFGNAGAFAFSDILPLATSGKLPRVPGWLLDPLGPLSIPPAYLPKILPWLVRFWREGRPDRIARSIAAQTALMRLAASEMEAMTRAAGLTGMVRSDGSLELYESERELAAGARGWQARTEAGITFEARPGRPARRVAARHFAAFPRRHLCP